MTGKLTFAQMHWRGDGIHTVVLFNGSANVTHPELEERCQRLQQRGGPP